MLRQFNSGLVANETAESPAFLAIYIAAKENDNAAIEKIRAEYGSLDIYEDGSQYGYPKDIHTNIDLFDKDSPDVIDFYQFHIKKITPLALLAYQGNEEAVNFLLSQGANERFAAYGYARAGNIDKVDNLISRSIKEHPGINLGFIKFRIEPGICVLFALCGYHDAGFLANQDNLLCLLTQSKLRRGLYKIINKYKLYPYEMEKLYSKAVQLSHLINQYNLTFDQALLWATHSELYFWFRDSIELVKRDELPFQAILIIASYMLPSLSVIDAEVFYEKMTLDAHRIPLVNDLKNYEAPEFTQACEKAQSNKELYDLLRQDPSPLSKLSLFNGKNLLHGCKQLLSLEPKNSTTNMLDRHYSRLHSRLKSGYYKNPSQSGIMPPSFTH